jgi:hypothetical protein
VRGGARGIEPPPPEVADSATEATQMLVRDAGDETEATRLLPSREQVTPAEPRRPVSPVAPAPVPPANRRAERDAQAKRRRRRRLLRFLVAFILLGALAVGAIVVADQSSNNPHLRRVTAQDAQQAIDEVKQFVQDNTK